MWWGLKSHLENRMLAVLFSEGKLYQGFWLHRLLCRAGSSSRIWLTFLTVSCPFPLSPFTQAVWGTIWTYTLCVWRMTQDKETASKWSLEKQETEHTGKRATHGGKRPERKKNIQQQQTTTRLFFNPARSLSVDSKVWVRGDSSHLWKAHRQADMEASAGDRMALSSQIQQELVTVPSNLQRSTIITQNIPEKKNGTTEGNAHFTCQQDSPPSENHCSA